MTTQDEELRELLEYGLLVQYDNGLLGMANGPEWWLLPLCNDMEFLP